MYAGGNQRFYDGDKISSRAHTSSSSLYPPSPVSQRRPSLKQFPSQSYHSPQHSVAQYEEFIPVHEPLSTNNFESPAEGNVFTFEDFFLEGPDDDSHTRTTTAASSKEEPTFNTPATPIDSSKNAIRMDDFEDNTREIPRPPQLLVADEPPIRPETPRRWRTRSRTATPRRSRSTPRLRVQIPPDDDVSIEEAVSYVTVESIQQRMAQDDIEFLGAVKLSDQRTASPQRSIRRAEKAIRSVKKVLDFMKRSPKKATVEYDRLPVLSIPQQRSLDPGLSEHKRNLSKRHGRSRSMDRSRGRSSSRKRTPRIKNQTSRQRSRSKTKPGARNKTTQRQNQNEYSTTTTETDASNSVVDTIETVKSHESVSSVTLLWQWLICTDIEGVTPMCTAPEREDLTIDSNSALSSQSHSLEPSMADDDSIPAQPPIRQPISKPRSPTRRFPEEYHRPTFHTVTNHSGLLDEKTNQGNEGQRTHRRMVSNTSTEDMLIPPPKFLQKEKIRSSLSELHTQPPKFSRKRSYY